MYNDKITMLMNDIELLLSENNCTISEVDAIVKNLAEDVKMQIEDSGQYFRPTWALLLYGIADDVRKRIGLKNDISKIDPLKFVKTH